MPTGLLPLIDKSYCCCSSPCCCCYSSCCCCCCCSSSCCCYSPAPLLLLFRLPHLLFFSFFFCLFFPSRFCNGNGQPRLRSQHTICRLPLSFELFIVFKTVVGLGRCSCCVCCVRTGHQQRHQHQSASANVSSNQKLNDTFGLPAFFHQLFVSANPAGVVAFAWVASKTKQASPAPCRNKQREFFAHHDMCNTRVVRMAKSSSDPLQIVVGLVVGQLIRFCCPINHTVLGLKFCVRGLL